MKTKSHQKVVKRKDGTLLCVEFSRYNTFDLFPTICVTLGKNNHIPQKYGLYNRG